MEGGVRDGSTVGAEESSAAGGGPQYRSWAYFVECYRDNRVTLSYESSFRSIRCRRKPRSEETSTYIWECTPLEQSGEPACV